MDADTTINKGDTVMDYRESFRSWLQGDVFDTDTKEELKTIENDDKEIRERFGRDLEFGTAGMRGVIGAGTNRINRYVVRRATQGLANYILKKGLGEKGVVIACDSRRMSPEFSEEAALCLCANGIPAYIFPSLRPTPVLSFAVRYFGAAAGINVTASHNPPEYNGYKVYWSDGAQVTPPHDVGIMAEVNAITDYAAPKTMDRAAAEKAGLFRCLGPEVDDAYIAAVKKEIRRPEVIAAEGKNLKIVYSPLHGTGNIPVRRILKELGFANVYVVPEQELPDGEFPTVNYPNPEAAEAFSLGLQLAEKVGADLVLATDPDADRLGVYARSADGSYHSMTGNMSGCLLADYEIGSIRDTKGLPEGGELISTIVSSNMAGAVARKYGVAFKEVLTGFKYIGEEILRMEESGKGSYLFGFEESYGCLIGTYARDKDAVAAVVALCEAACYYRTRGMDLNEALEALYRELGYYRDMVISKSFSGLEGLEKMAEIMEELRRKPFASLAGLKVLALRDYKTGFRRDLVSGESAPVDLPVSNVLYFELEGDAWCCVRPSGTEPKIKLYCGVRGRTAAEAEALENKMKEELTELL